GGSGYIKQCHSSRDQSHSSHACPTGIVAPGAGARPLALTLLVIGAVAVLSPPREPRASGGLREHPRAVALSPLSPSPGIGLRWAIRTSVVNRRVPNSLVPYRRERIDPGRLPRGHVTGCQRGA